jgi:23S rRNA-/tRNA-specific pseudouridylate synthase
VYWAVVRSEVPGDQGRIDSPLLRRTGPGGWRIVIDQAGQPAITDWRVLSRAPGLTWLELRPKTGRTHQVRVHCASLGAPILGDERYGGGPGQLQLLARSILLPLDPPVEATADPPTHMVATLARCGFRGWGTRFLHRQ